MKILNIDLKLKQQLITLFLIFAIVPSAAITVITLTSNSQTLNESKTSITDLQMETLAGLSDQYSDIVNSWVHDEYKVVDIMGQDPLIRTNVELLGNSSTSSMANFQLADLFSGWIDLYEGIEEMMLLNYTSGDVMISRAASGFTNTSANQLTNEYFTGAKTTEGINLDTGKPYFKDIYLDGTTYKMAFSHVIRPYGQDGGTPVAVFVTIVDANVLWNLIAPRDSSNNPIQSYYSKVGLGETGEVYLMNSNGIAISRSRHETTDSTFVLKKDLSSTQGFIDAMASGYKIGPGSDYEGNAVYGVYVYLGASPTSTDQRDSFLIERLDYDLHWVLGIDIDQAEVLAPVYHIQDQQNLSMMFTIGVIGAIAVVVLAVAFVVSNSISKPIIKLSKVSQSMAEGDLTVDIEKTNKKDEVGDLQTAFGTMISFLKPSVESISDVAKTLAASAQEMASSSEEVNASSEEMSSVSQQISKGAQQQTEYLSRSIKQMEDIQNQFSEKIAGIKVASDLIESISTQVNMLALNASIEAARAGEYGRGFAVVADNIRRLADDAKNSVDRVNRIIEDLTITISSGMDTLSTSMTSVTTVAEETASGAEEASAATEEQAATMEELSASAQELAKVSIDLEEIVKRFVLN